jgi:hypothetical protein
MLVDGFDLFHGERTLQTQTNEPDIRQNTQYFTFQKQKLQKSIKSVLQ